MNNLYQEPLNKRALFAVFFPFLQGLLVFLYFNTSLLNLLKDFTPDLNFAISIITIMALFIGDILCISWAVNERDRYRTSCLIPILLNLGLLCAKIFAIGFGLVFLFTFPH